MTKKYLVLGIAGEKVNINGVDYIGREDTVELSDEEAAQPLAESKIALFPEETSGTQVGEEVAEATGTEEEATDNVEATEVEESSVENTEEDTESETTSSESVV